MAMNGILIALFEMVIVFRLEGTIPYLKLMKYGTILMAIAYFMLNIPLANGFIIAIAAMLMITVAEMIAMPFMNTWYIGRTNAANRGQYAALYTMAWSSAQVTGSLTGTLIVHKMSYFILWWIIGTLCIITAWGFNYIATKR
jgi:predicted MFS family arabinose efflux permease